MFVDPKYRGKKEYYIVCERLKLAAGNRRKIYYATVFDIMHLKAGDYAAKEAGHLLGEISEDSHSDRKPMLTAIVVSQNTERPGSGFYELAVKLGKLPLDATEADKERFWRLEVNRVYSTVW